MGSRPPRGFERAHQVHMASRDATSRVVNSSPLAPDSTIVITQRHLQSWRGEPCVLVASVDALPVEFLVSRAKVADQGFESRPTAPKLPARGNQPTSFAKVGRHWPNGGQTTRPGVTVAVEDDRSNQTACPAGTDATTRPRSRVLQIATRHDGSSAIGQGSVYANH